jgi:hypothetical protein
MHVQGQYTAWNRDAAEIGLRLFAQRAGTEAESLATRSLETFSYWMVLHLLHRMLRQQHAALPDFPHGPANRELLRLLCTGATTLGLSLHPRCLHPVVAIGAPAGVLAWAAAATLGASLIVPEHAEVANAVGAISGVFTLQLDAVILPDDEHFVAHTPEERRIFADFDAAREWTHTAMAALLDARLRDAQLDGFAFEKSLLGSDRIGTLDTGTVFLEYHLRALAVGRPLFHGFVDA